MSAICVICSKSILDTYRCKRCEKLCDITKIGFRLVRFQSVCCNGDIEPITRVTCSTICHERYVKELEEQVGEYKRVTDSTTGISYRVPVRTIAEEGLKFSDLSKFPVWPEGEVNEGNPQAD